MKGYTTNVKFHVVICLAIIVFSVVLGEIRAGKRSAASPANNEMEVPLSDTENNEPEPGVSVSDTNQKVFSVESGGTDEDKVTAVDREEVVSQAIAKAEENEKKQLYAEGIKIINDALEIVPGDGRLIAIKEKLNSLRADEYVAGIETRVQEAISKDGFGAAYKIIKAAITASAADDAVINRISEYEKYFSNDWKTTVIDRIGEESEGDIELLLADIREICAVLTRDIDLLTAQEYYSEKYKESIFDSVETTYDEKGCEGVVSILDTASKLLPEDKDIIDAWNIWKQRASMVVDLSAVKVLNKHYVEYNYVLSDEDRYGTIYTSQISPCREDSYIEFLVGDYARIRGIYYISSWFEPAHEKYLDRARVRFYNEDNELLGELSSFGSINSKPIEFCIDIRNVDILKVEFSDCFISGLYNSYLALGDVNFGW